MKCQRLRHPWWPNATPRRTDALKVHVILADVGDRREPWQPESAERWMDLDDGDYPNLPKVVAILFEVPWNRLNQALRGLRAVELVTDEGALAQLQTVNGPIPRAN